MNVQSSLYVRIIALLKQEINAIDDVLDDIELIEEDDDDTNTEARRIKCAKIPQEADAGGGR